jgi:glycosidase
LSELGVTSVIIKDVLKTDEFGGIMDFKNIDDSHGTIGEFAEAVRKLKNAGLRVLMTLVPNHSSTKHKWFVDNAEHKFHDYYVRKTPAEIFGSSWLSVDATSQSAWATDLNHNDTSQYLQLFKGTADLNFKNPKVVDEMAVSKHFAILVLCDQFL